MNTNSNTKEMRKQQAPTSAAKEIHEVEKTNLGLMYILVYYFASCLGGVGCCAV